MLKNILNYGLRHNFIYSKNVELKREYRVFTSNKIYINDLIHY